MTSVDIVILVTVCLFGACCLADRALSAYRMKMRARNIAAAGWPPSHVDADGDPIAAREQGEEEA